MLSLTLQIYAEGKWQDALLLTFDTPQQGFDSRCSFGYGCRQGKPMKCRNWWPNT